MATAYNADSIVVIENDRKRVQQSPNMYVPNRGKLGTIHCVFENFDNSLDEVSIPNSIGNKIRVTFDEDTKAFSVEDNGRGIPQEKLYDVITVLAASGKFNNSEKSAYLASGGAFGHGLTVTWALSSHFEGYSTRNGKTLGYIFDEDKDGLKEKKVEKKADPKAHGTLMKLILNPKYIDTSEVTGKDIAERIEEKSYIFPNIDIELKVTSKKGEKVYKYGKKTIADKLSKWKLSTSMFEIHDVRNWTHLKDITDDKLTTEKVKLDCVFGFSEDVLDSEHPEDYTISYVNTIKTYAGGVHVEGVKLGIQKYFKEQVIPKFKGKDKELNILPSDMYAGLTMFVVASVSSPEFRGQEKTELSNPEVKGAVRDAVYDYLCSCKSGQINQMVEFVKRVTKGRMASKKVRKKDVSNTFSKDRLDKFKDIVENLDTVSREILLVEGEELPLSILRVHHTGIST